MLHPDIRSSATDQWIGKLEDKVRRAIENMIQGEPWTLDLRSDQEDESSSKGSEQTLESLSYLLTSLASEAEIQDSDMRDIQIIIAYLSAPRRFQIFEALQNSAAFDSGARLLQKIETTRQYFRSQEAEIFGDQNVEDTARTILRDTVLHILQRTSLASLFNPERIARIARIAREQMNHQHSAHSNN